METQVLAWILFSAVVLGVLALDLLVVHRRPREMRLREALAWVALWVSLAMGFAIFIFIWQGGKPALEFLTGYVVEESLSVDNMFVFLVVFAYFSVPRALQHRVLFWGILGALIMRLALILLGVALIQRFHWVLYLFGLFLVLTGARLALQKHENINPEANVVLRLLRRLLPVTEGYEGGRFVIRRAQKPAATPLLVVLVLIETTDLMFALDSIPAVLAVTRDPFIVYTSNVFAILGLRALFFALAGALELFRYLRYGLAVILVFIGAKLLISGFYEIPLGLALGVVIGVLTVSILVSVIDKRPTERFTSPLGETHRAEREHPISPIPEAPVPPPARTESL